MGLIRKLAEQARRPSGLLGRVAGWRMSRQNQMANEWTVALLDVQPTDHVLEIGFGPGVGIQKVVALASEGRVSGVDHSELMVKQASKRNAQGIASGRVDLRHGIASSLPYADDTVDKVLSVNVIYFWPDPLSIMKEIRRVMKPGGRVAFHMPDIQEAMSGALTVPGVFYWYTGEEIAELLTRAGFGEPRIERQTVYSVPRRPMPSGLCVLAEKQHLMPSIRSS